MLIPRQDELVNAETQDAFNALINGIRHAETDRELLVYMETFHRAATEMRAIFTMIEGEAVRRLRAIRDEIEAGSFEQAMGSLHQVRERADVRQEQEQ